jgi:hypothetical protein
MENDMEAAVDPKDRFVAFFDILGFRNALRVRTLSELAQDYRQSKIEARQTQAMTVRYSNPFAGSFEGGQFFVEIEDPVAVFSDSIFVFTKDTSYNSIHAICQFANTLFRLFLKRKLPLRGAITQGEVVIDASNSLFLGQPIVDAYDLAESIDGLGIVLSPELQQNPNSIASMELEIACQDKKKQTKFTQKLLVPVAGFAPADMGERDWQNIFRQLRDEAGEKYAPRYQQSETTVAAMLNIDPELLKAPTVSS